MSNLQTIVAATFALGVILLHAAPAQAQWIELVDGTTEHVEGSGFTDPEEKSYAWGDLNLNGWIDLVVARKQPWSTPGTRANVLYINENGVLVDRTEQYATDADDGGQGFLDFTNDRDIIMADVNGDGWLDVVTAVTLSDGQPETISHPRVYVNKGDERGNWLGLRYEEARIPAYDIAPRFQAVAAGDVTGDGMADLYFGYNRLGGSAPPFDLHDRLLINSGAGSFADESEARMTLEMRESFACMAVAIADINLDGANDIVKSVAVTPPQRTTIIYNDPDNEGHFTSIQVVQPVGSPIDLSIGDLSNNGRLDFVIPQDGSADRYYLNQSAGGGTEVQFTSHVLPQVAGQVTGFGGDSVIADLDGDGWRDIIITDVNFDIVGCNRHTNIHRNNGDGPDVTFTNESSIIPAAMRQGGFDAAVFDLTGNGRMDIVLGRCQSAEAWVQPGPPPITGDLNGDGHVDVQDLLILLSSWGACPKPPADCPADIDNSGAVDVQDLLILLANWG